MLVLLLPEVTATHENGIQNPGDAIIAQPARYFCNAVISLNHLPDRFDLERFGISFATHLHLSNIAILYA